MKDDDVYEKLKDHDFMRLMSYCTSNALREKEKGIKFDPLYVKNNIETMYKMAVDDSTKWTAMCSLYCMKEIMDERLKSENK